MSATDEYMAFLQENPEFYSFFTKNTLAMRVVHALADEQELIVEDLKRKLKCDWLELDCVLNTLVDFRLAERERLDKTWLYYLSPQGLRLYTLYEKAKKEL